MDDTIIQYIGKIDKQKFKEISNEVITEEVILTSKQRQHIIERHPEVYKIVENRFQEIIEKPDYILKDKSKENTAMVIKLIKEEDKIVNIILKLATKENEDRNKNSIITCIPIGKNRIKSYLKNGKIVYKWE